MASAVQQHMCIVTIPNGVGPGMRFRASHPSSGGLFEVVVPPGFSAGMQLQVAVPDVVAHHSRGGRRQPTRDEAVQTLAWVCGRCTLENEGSAVECAACGGRRPREAEMSEEEQLAIALALSQGNTSGGGSGGGGGGGSGGGGGGGGGLHTAGVARKWGEGGLDETAAPSVPGRPGLSAAEQEELLLAQSNVAPSLRNDPVVAAQAFRVAGDARGTASTLVGLTPEEEMELAMLKSKIAHEQPELNSPLPRADAAAGRGGGGSYLSAFGGGTATTATFDAGAPLQLPSIAPLVAPPQHAAGSRSRGATGTLREGLLGSDFAQQPLAAEGLGRKPPPPDSRALAGARKQRTPPSYAPNVQYQPPTLPTAAAQPTSVPVAAPEAPLAPAIPGYEDEDDPPFSNWTEDPEEWDDADRPLQTAPTPPSDAHATPDSNPRRGLLARERSEEMAHNVRSGGNVLSGGYANLMD